MPGHIAYLVGQFPAINHYYLLREIGFLRAAGWTIETISVLAPDRPLPQMRREEQDAARATFYLNRTSPAMAVWSLLCCLFRRPASTWRAARLASRLSRSQGRPAIYALYYLAQAILLGDWMTARGLSHVHVSFSAHLATIASPLFGFTWSFGVYGYGELYDPSSGELGLKIASANLVRSVSQHGVGQMMLACAPEHWSKLRHIDLGIDPTGFPPRPAPAAPRPLSLISVGRLSPEKGQRILLEAVALVTGRGRQVQLSLVGDGPDRPILEQEARRQCPPGSIVFHGRLPQAQLEDLYRQAGAFVLGSLYEGTPIVLMEAMAMEIPCIAPSINGVPEVVIHGETGLLYAPGSAVALADCIERLIDDPALGLRFGPAGRQRVLAHYDLGKQSLVWARQLEAVLAPSSDTRLA